VTRLNNYDLAKSYIRQAEERIKHAKEALSEGSYPYTVRQCQEAVELLLKAALRYVGVEPPKLHDVGPLLRKERDRFPAWFQERIDEFAYYSRVLRSERRTSDVRGRRNRNAAGRIVFEIRCRKRNEDVRYCS